MYASIYNGCHLFEMTSSQVREVSRTPDQSSRPRQCTGRASGSVVGCPAERGATLPCRWRRRDGAPRLATPPAALAEVVWTDGA